MLHVSMCRDTFRKECRNCKINSSGGFLKAPNEKHDRVIHGIFDLRPSYILTLIRCELLAIGLHLRLEMLPLINLNLFLSWIVFVRK